MSVEQILSDIRARKHSPLYFFYGEEPFYTDLLTREVERHMLDESEKAFNMTVIYGKEAEAGSLIETARRLPMMAPINLVLLKEAQDFRKIDELLPYVENPVTSTVLLIAWKYRKPDKRKKFFKTLIAKSVSHESSPVRDYQLGAWIRKHTATKGAEISEKAALLLGEHVGTDLSRIDHELDKLIDLLPEGNVQITEDQISRYTGISKEYNIFELVNALGEGRTTMVNRIVKNFELNPKNYPMPMLMFHLAAFFQKLYLFHFHHRGNEHETARAIGVNPYFVKQYQRAAGRFNLLQIERIMGILLQYDLRSKGVKNVQTADLDLLKEMVFKIQAAR